MNECISGTGDFLLLELSVPVIGAGRSSLEGNLAKSLYFRIIEATDLGIA